MFWQDFQIHCVFPDREFLWPFSLFSLCSGYPTTGMMGNVSLGSYHKTSHTLLLYTLLFLLLLTLGVGVVDHDGLVHFTGLSRHIAMEFLELLGMLKHCIQIFLENQFYLVMNPLPMTTNFNVYILGETSIPTDLQFYKKKKKKKSQESQQDKINLVCNSIFANQVYIICQISGCIRLPGQSCRV